MAKRRTNRSPATRLPQRPNEARPSEQARPTKETSPKPQPAKEGKGTTPKRAQPSTTKIGKVIRFPSSIVDTYFRAQRATGNSPSAAVILAYERSSAEFLKTQQPNRSKLLNESLTSTRALPKGDSWKPVKILAMPSTWNRWSSEAEQSQLSLSAFLTDLLNYDSDRPA